MTKHNGHKVFKAVAAVVAVGAVGVCNAGTVSATHTHSMETGNGSCVLLAQNGGEANVSLPHADGPENLRHPLLVNVHLCAPGRSGQVGVLGTASDTCLGGDYLND